MNPMNRVGLAALLAALGTLVAASPALAGKKVNPVNSTTFQLAPPVQAPEPDASGMWTLDVYTGAWLYPWPYECATVSCHRLTPRKQYVVRVLVDWYDDSAWGVGASGSYFEEHAATADRKGTLHAEVCVLSEGGDEGSWWWCTVRRIAGLGIVNANGQIVLEQP